jgi:CHASE3 domain sensor protein
MARKKQRESAAAFLRRVSEKEIDKEAREWIEEALTVAQRQAIALATMGTITVLVVPGGAFANYISPHLLSSRGALNSVEQALDDVRKEIHLIRDKLIDKEIEKKTKEIVKKQEE